MLGAGYSWRLFFYVEAAFAGVLLILAFFFIEESTYHRPEQAISASVSDRSLDGDGGTDKIHAPVQLEHIRPISVPPRKSFLATLKPWSAIDRDAEFFATIYRSFTYFCVPAVFWVITSYGRYVSFVNPFAEFI
jgi:hypothetical protein